jgi:NAD(P)-dependent dehydrogenase (short-subunit alcohol dehydrogenase family)
MQQIILITGASSGFGLITAKALARAGHTVYASMRETRSKNARAVSEVTDFARDHDVDLRTVELDVLDQASVDAAIEHVRAQAGGLDVIVHNAGHMTFGPAEAFAPEQIATLFDVNVLSTQRLNRAALPHLRKTGGLVIWVSSSSARGGVPPYLGPYFAVKAAMDQLAVSYAGEIARFGVETTIVMPGAFTKGTKHFTNAEQPKDETRAEVYKRVNDDFEDKILKGLAALEPNDADPSSVADAIVTVVNAPKGKRPYRIHFRGRRRHRCGHVRPDAIGDVAPDRARRCPDGRAYLSTSALERQGGVTTDRGPVQLSEVSENRR